MTTLRRSLLKLPLAAIASPLAADLAAPPLGRIAPRRSREIAASPFSIGFELLDRKLFDPERAYPMVAQLGVKWARTQTGWSRCETVKGKYDFAWLDRVVDSLLSAGVQPWFNLGFGNRLYTPEAPHETAVGFPPMNSPEAKAAWVRFAGAIAHHFRTRVRHWEIWNEPNISAFWRPNQPSAVGYMELLQMTAPEIRKQIPKAVIVGGGFSGVPLDFIEQCLELGFARHADRLSIHPYRHQPEIGYESEVRALRKMLAKYRPGLALWQGENGVRSANTTYNQEWTEDKQVRWILRRLVSDLKMEMELTSIYHTVDCPDYFIWSKESSGWKMAAGLLHADFTPKPSYHAYQSLCALFDAQTERADLPISVEGTAGPEKLARAAISTGAWVRKGRPLYAYWYPTDFSTPFAPHQATLALWSSRSVPMAAPVVVDPLTAQVHSVKVLRHADGTWKVSAPLTDYPLLLTDRSAVLS